MANIIAGDNVINVQMVRITGNLSGTVTDADTGVPLSGAVVTIGGLSVSTGQQGQYAFEGLTPGTYTVTFEISGYYAETR